MSSNPARRARANAWRAPTASWTPPQSSKLLVSKRLDAETEPRDARLEVPRQPDVGRRLGIRLHRDLRLRRERPRRPAGCDDSADVVRRQHRRRPAAEIHRVGLAQPVGLLDFEDNGIDVSPSQVIVEQPPGEVAVRADRLAERHVHVQPDWSGGRHRHPPAGRTDRREDRFRHGVPALPPGHRTSACPRRIWALSCPDARRRTPRLGRFWFL